MTYNNLSLVELTRMKKSIRQKINVLENKLKVAGNQVLADQISKELNDAKIIMKQINDAIAPKLDEQLKDIIK